jgi:hypothetical protein
MWPRAKTAKTTKYKKCMRPRAKIDKKTNVRGPGPILSKKKKKKTENKVRKMYVAQGQY